MVPNETPEVSIRFELSAPGIGLADIRLRSSDARWAAATTIRDRTHIGLGATAREALTASLATVGRIHAAALLADPRLFGVSAAIRRTA